MMQAIYFQTTSRDLKKKKEASSFPFSSPIQREVSDHRENRYVSSLSSIPLLLLEKQSQEGACLLVQGA